MDSAQLQQLKQRYEEQGFVSAVPILTCEEAAAHRTAMEQAEEQIGRLHYKTKVHTILQSPLELATLPKVLDIVAAILGPNILLYNVTYIVKEAGAASHVSWHQDLTYWGLSHDDQVSMWLALSPATAETGCMRMIPASHKQGRLEHHATDDKNNVLLQGQTVQSVDEGKAVTCPLAPGEASFHHGWTLHASMPNRGQDRRIGLNVQYFATHVRQTKHEVDSALLVRGTDEYGYFEADVPASVAIDLAALERQQRLEAHYRAIAGRGNSA